MSRLRASALAVVAAGALAVAPAAQAADPPMVCPNGFVPFLLPIYPPEVDQNGNFIVCVKETEGTLVWHDDLLDLG